MAYKKIENFRFWCQKVLPLVYDDSLSYYEVLCKIRDLINGIIDNMDSLADAIEDLDTRLDKVEAKLNDLSKLIIDEVKKYIQSDDFVEQLIDELTSSQTFNNWFHDFITNNPDLIQDLINSEYFDEYFNDYITNNPDIVNSLLSNPNFISNFAETMARQTDFYDIVNITDGDISKGGLVSNFYAIGKNSQIAAGTRIKVMYRPTPSPIVGKFQRTSSGGFYNWSADGDTAYTSFIIDMRGFEGRNLYIKIDEAFDPYSYTFIKRGSLDTGGVSITSDKGTPTGQASYIPGDFLKLEPTKAVNFVLISVKNNGVAFTPTFTYSMRNVDFDSNTDTPVLIPFNAFQVWDGASDTAINTLELFKPNNELAYIIFGAIGSTQYSLSEDITSTNSDVSNLQEDMTELKNSVSDGKALVASAITDKGVATASDASFGVMASNIRNIPTGDANNLFGYLEGTYTDIDNYDITQLGFVDLGITSSSDFLRRQLIAAGVNVTDLDENNAFNILPSVTGSTAGWAFQVQSSGSIYLKYANGAHMDLVSFKQFSIHLYVKILPNGGLLLGNPYNDVTNGVVLGFCGASSAFELQNNTEGFYLFSNIYPNRNLASDARIYVSASPTSGGTNNILRKSLQVYTNEYLYIEPAVSTETYGTANCVLDNLGVPYCAKNYLEGDASNGYIFTDTNGNVFWLPTAGTATTATNSQKVCVRLSD